MKKMLIPIIAVVVIGVAALVYFLVLAPSGEKEEPEIVTAVYNVGDSFITNVKGTDGRESGRLFRAGVYLVVDERMMEELSDKTSPKIPLIRDTVLFVLRDLTAEDILVPGNAENIRQRIVDAVNERLGLVDEPGKATKPKVLDVYFTDFVMQ